MKAIFPLLSAALLLTGGSVLADLVVVQRVESSAAGTPMNETLTIRIKGDQARIDVGERMSSILNANSDKVVSLMHDRKMVLSMDADKVGSMQRQLLDALGKKSGGGAETAPELRATGETRSINGFETERFTATQQGQEVSYWIARNHPDKEDILRQMAILQKSDLLRMAPGAEATLDIKKFPGIPIKIESGDTVSTIQSITRAEVDAAIFETPADYKSFDMPDMGDLLKNLPTGQ